MKPELASVPDRICTSNEKAVNQGLWEYPTPPGPPGAGVTGYREPLYKGAGSPYPS